MTWAPEIIIIISKIKYTCKDQHRKGKSDFFFWICLSSLYVNQEASVLRSERGNGGSLMKQGKQDCESLQPPSKTRGFPLNILIYLHLCRAFSHLPLVPCSVFGIHDVFLKPRMAFMLLSWVSSSWAQENGPGPSDCPHPPDGTGACV